MVRSTKGSKSKTHHGDMDYTSKSGNKDHHIGGHDVEESHAPFQKKKSKRRGNPDKLKELWAKAHAQGLKKITKGMKCDGKKCPKK